MAKEVYVYADWQDFIEPALIGVLRSDVIRNDEHFSFRYDPSWLLSPFVQKVDPDLELYAGEQHRADPRNFRAFLDSCPDRWGRLLMRRREAILARREERRPARLSELDYLLGVHDFHRQGALRFKQEPDGDFLDNNSRMAAPPMTSLKELAHAASQVESREDRQDDEYLEWLSLLMAPGSSLGGACPKASVRDENNQLWIAKFPSRYDDYDIAAWEFLTWQLACNAGVIMAESKLVRFNNDHHTFLTRRFDRTPESRLHFSSAMTQLGYYDGGYEASYLELAQFLTEKGVQSREDLAQLWRRIVFNIAVSNSDDHLRNHGFIFQDSGWRLSPAYDINPVPDARGLHLNISDSDNRLDFELALEVAEFFQLSSADAEKIKAEVVSSVSRWHQAASEIGLSRQEQELMAPAFNL